MSSLFNSAASTSASPLHELAQRGKRKASDDDISHGSPPAPPFIHDDADEDENGQQQPSRKKIHLEPEEKDKEKEKVKKPKVAVWKDLNQWKEGDDPLGRFPIEVLDLIISVDSDLDLRDHLALAATCRYFRTCYRDVVFQVLFQAACPDFEIGSPTLLRIDHDGVPKFNGYRFSYDTFLGPFERGLNAGRRIFSSSSSLVGAGGWCSWGLARTEYDANLEEANRKKNHLEEALNKYWDERPLVVQDEPGGWEHMSGLWSNLTGDQGEAAKESFKKIELDSLESKRRRDRRILRNVHGLDADPSDDKRSFFWDEELASIESDEYDPWPSPWRQVVARIVLTPSVNKTTAKTKYKVTDRELLGLKERKNVPGGSRSSKYYYTAAVEALSLRAHGGINGHAEHLAKLEARKTKAHATRVKNGTVVEKNPKPATALERLTALHQAMLDAYYEDEFSMFGYDSDEEFDDGYEDYIGSMF